jgi:hypothetical protein
MVSLVLQLHTAASQIEYSIYSSDVCGGFVWASLGHFCVDSNAASLFLPSFDPEMTIT